MHHNYWAAKNEHCGGGRHSDKEKIFEVISITQMSERLLKTLRKSGDFQVEYRLPSHYVAAQAAASNSNLRWLRVPATTDACDSKSSRAPTSERKSGFFLPQIAGSRPDRRAALSPGTSDT